MLIRYYAQWYISSILIRKSQPRKWCGHLAHCGTGILHAVVRASRPLWHGHLARCGAGVSPAVARASCTLWHRHLARARERDAPATAGGTPAPHRRPASKKLCKNRAVILSPSLSPRAKRRVCSLPTQGKLREASAFISSKTKKCRLLASLGVTWFDGFFTPSKVPELPADSRLK